MFSGSLPVLLACGLLASCDKGEMTHTEGTPLPEGKYPLVLTAGGLQAVAGQGRASAPGTRGTTDNDWEGVTTVAVQVDGEVKPYTVTPSADKITATLTAADPFYWQTSDEKKTITAWHPADANPADWKVQANQSTKENYEASDLIRGNLELEFADKDNPEKNKMVFTHQTAKVKIDLQAGAGVTLGDNVSVQLVNIDGVNSGNTVTPYPPDTDAHSYLALLNGQDIRANEQFIKVSVDGTDFYYTPTSGMTLEAGLVYTYTITVKANGNGIEVTEATSGAWTPGGEEAVKSIVFKTDLSTAKVGDFITTDGKLLEMTESMTLSEEMKKRIAGVVFWVPEKKDPHRQTQASLQSDEVMAKAHPNCTHGLAVSLKDVSAEMKWQGGQYEAVLNFQRGDAFNPAYDKSLFKPIASNDGSGDPINFILGYQNTLILRAYNEYCRSTPGKENHVVLPVDALAGFETNNPSPSNSTGWFLPSPKELHILCYKDVDNIGRYWEDPSYTDTRDIVNNSLTAADGGTFAYNYYYWSSSEFGGFLSHAFIVNFRNSNVLSVSKYYNTYRVRAVCAF